MSAYRKVSKGQPTGYDLGVATVIDRSTSKLRRAVGMLLSIALMLLMAMLNVLDRHAIEDLTYPSAWTNPVTQRQVTIPAQWQYQLLTGPDDNPLYSFVRMQTGRVALLAVEDLPALDLEGYASALGAVLSADMTLADWKASVLAAGLLETSGRMKEGDKPVVIYALQHESRFWRLVVIDQLKPFPDDDSHIALARALIESIGYR